MAENSPIEWTDHTWSPWEGCQKVGPGCDHCYAEGMNRWLRKGENWGPGAPRRAYSDEHWEKPLRWNAAAKKAGVQLKVFPSVCDPFDNEVSTEWRARFFDLIGRTPHLTWLLLTKRIGNAAKMLPWMPDGAKHCHIASSELWPNVWLGATVVNQEEADRDIPKLMLTPARVRFLSIEPLLAPVRPESLRITQAVAKALRCQGDHIDALHPNWRARGVGLHWVIAGGESGPNARPMHPDWARSLRDQCAAAGVPFLFKQVGEAVPVETDVDTDHGHTVYPLDDSVVLPRDRYKLHTGPNAQYFVRVPKKAAGRLLDGRTHDEFPEVRHG